MFKRLLNPDLQSELLVMGPLTRFLVLLPAVLASTTLVSLLANGGAA